MDPDLGAYAEPWLARETEHVYRDEWGTTHVISATTGVDQGCAASPLLFPVALHPGLEELQRRLLAIDGQAKVVAYQDDVQVLARPDTFAAVAAWLDGLFECYGLVVAMGKCAYFDPRPTTNTAIPFPPHGGAPYGEDAAPHSRCERRMPSSVSGAGGYCPSS